MTLTVIELRQYTLHPGRRDELIDLFVGELIEPQEKDGMTILGVFRDLDDPDRFVWLRGFPDMPSRARSLDAFYNGPIWARHANAANATMLDSSDARLLRPVAGDFPQAYEGTHSITINQPGTPAPGALITLTTLDAANNFPRLPVRTDEGPIDVSLFSTDIPGALRLSSAL
ncbi:NIPSNAP family protein [Actinomadura barringtoniae]|uniref:NIPSNAP family protein n=1 Tax=Actinomadura barringtoniae TaxID=1427535 RepID=A0A939T5A9_9ACTN|nr:NIPSNAP family protein [Actinomadura barringtoniae]MBO2450413.1 NIPSNAP family protein [Actinomadura barringtoniae]